VALHGNVQRNALVSSLFLARPFPDVNRRHNYSSDK
jgi:hypothetical protein